MSTDHDSYHDIIDWLLQLPANTTVVWGDDHTTTGDVHTGWIDVSPADADLGYNWLWTIVDGSDPDDVTGDDPTVVVVDHDRTLWVVWDDDEHWWLPEPFHVTDIGAIPEPERLGELEAAADEFSERRSLISRDGWSVDAVNTALRNWVHVHSGRDDINFRFDAALNPHQDLLDDIDATVEALAAGTCDTYEIAPGIAATDSVLDFLLAQDPDVAAELTATLNDVLEPYVRERRDNT